jgi:probable F420-dependent oxidoreductase
VSAPTIGLFAVNSHECARPEAAARVAGLAERLGYDSLWAGEHVVVPSPRVDPSPMEPDEPMLDPLVALAHLAAHTERIRLGTGVIVLPQRNPLVLAKQVATLDVLSGGRAMLGVGAGYLEAEFRAIGADFAARGPITDEYLDAMAALWYHERPAYHGRFVDFAGVDAHPRPIQKPVPLIVGGHSPAAYRRAVARAHGWYGYWLAPDDVAQSLAGLGAAAERVERPEHLDRLEISVTPRGRLTPELAARFADLGVDRLVPLASPTADSPERTIESSVAALDAL